MVSVHVGKQPVSRFTVLAHLSAHVYLNEYNPHDMSMQDYSWAGQYMMAHCLYRTLYFMVLRACSTDTHTLHACRR